MTENKPFFTPLPEHTPIIQHVQQVSESARNSELSDEFQRNVALSAKKVAEFLECSEMQAILFCVIFNLNFRSGVVDVSDLGNYLSCSMVKVMTFISDINSLVEKRILRSNHGESKKRRRSFSSLNCYEYGVNKDVCESIIRNDERFIAKTEVFTDIFDLLKASSVIVKNDNYDSTEMTQEIADLIEQNQHLPLAKAIDQMELSVEAVALLLALANEYVGGEEDIELPHVLDRLYEFRDIMRLRREFLNSSHPLIIHDLVQLKQNSFRSDHTVNLTEKALNLLFQEDKRFFITPRKESHQFILAKDITEKKLFFSGELNRQLILLTSALTEPTYSQLRNRLIASGSKGGIAILCYGASGSGKTAFAMEVSRATNRSLYQVSISETKSKYFSESEKLTQRAFDDYRKLVESTKTCPILLFNECDGIITSRKTLGSYSNSIGQTETAIQTIINQEFENNIGIIICTSNFPQNLDMAMARRFLYKIRFDQGDQACRYAQWHEKLNRTFKSTKVLKDSEMHSLSELLLTGGQIENVIQKMLMVHLLENRYPPFSEIMEFCNQELRFLKDEKNRIGYLR